MLKMQSKRVSKQVATAIVIISDLWTAGVILDSNLKFRAIKTKAVVLSCQTRRLKFEEKNWLRKKMSYILQTRFSRTKMKFKTHPAASFSSLLSPFSDEHPHFDHHRLPFQAGSWAQEAG